MPEHLDDLMMVARPTPERPLAGHVILIVEDSRFASEALRLMCLRSGARVRRADTLASAARHLASYRPSVAIVDLGLPDGDGATLIRDLAEATTHRPVILAVSGDPGAEDAAREAGADGFIGKPVESLQTLMLKIAAHLPDPPPGSGTIEGVVVPDEMALQDDLAAVLAVLTAEDAHEHLAYAAQFLGSLARTAGDAALAELAEDLDRAAAGEADLGAALSRTTDAVSVRIGQRAVI